MGFRVGFGQVGRDSPASLDRPTIARVRINRAYDDSLASLAQISLVVRHTTPRRLEIKEPTQWPDLIRQEYGVSQDRLPRTHELLRDEIVRINLLDQPSSVQAGFLQIPFLPRAAALMPEFAIQRDTPVLFRFPSAGLGPPLTPNDEERVLIQGHPKRTQTNALQQYADLEFPIPDELVPTFSRALGKNFSPVIQRMGVYVASPCPELDDPHTILAPNQKDSVRKLLQRARRRTHLLILDTGWPEHEYGQSLSELEAILTDVRSRRQD